MKKSIQSLLIAAIVSVTVVCVQAAETASEVVVLKVKGAAKAVLPGSTTPVDIKAGTLLPQGSVIETPSGSVVDLQVFPGVVTTVEENSKVDLSKVSLTTSQGAVTKQSAIIGLTVGSVVSKLDPSKKAINDYSVSTPKGVAAARGTIYKVLVQNGVTTVVVLTGTVTFYNPITKQTVVVNKGMTVTVDTKGNISEPVDAGDSSLQGSTTVNTKGVDTTIVVSPSQ